MTQDSARQDLIKKLRDKCPLLNERDGSQRPIYDEEMTLLINFILERDKKIVRPLVNWINDFGLIEDDCKCGKCLDAKDALKNAGY